MDINFSHFIPNFGENLDQSDLIYFVFFFNPDCNLVTLFGIGSSLCGTFDYMPTELQQKRFAYGFLLLVILFFWL